MADAPETHVPNIVLNNGVNMPQVGLGVWQAEEGDEVKGAIKAALAAGYRHIDTAAAYGNEKSVGEAIRESDVPREEIFVTSKLWNDDQGYDSTLKAFDVTMEKLGFEYLDLYLIHWPVPMWDKYKDTWKAFEKLYNDKRIRAIGVSNFKPHHLQDLLDNCAQPPAVNQIELHPHFQQHETREFCAKHDIKVECYSPLKRGSDVLQDPVITELAKKHEKDPGQIVLRWHVQEGFIVIPKSVTPERIRSNIDLFDFELSNEEMERIRGMDREERILGDPDTFERP